MCCCIKSDKKNMQKIFTIALTCSGRNQILAHLNNTIQILIIDSKLLSNASKNFTKGVQPRSLMSYVKSLK
jgi:hypothetical protein